MKDNLKIIFNEIEEILPGNMVDREYPLDLSVIESKVNRAVTITGPRRAGKTWLLFQIMRSLLKKGWLLKDFLYLNFEDERLLPLTARELHCILDAWFELRGTDHKPLLFFDEIQNIRGWDNFVRRLIDQGYRVFLTGSNSRLLSSEIATTLRGRTYSQTIYPFSFREFLISKGITPDPTLLYSKERHALKVFFDQYLLIGGYPEIVLTEDPSLQGRIARDYFNAVFYRDIVERHHVTNTELLRNWMHLLLSNIASLVSFRKVEHDFKSRGLMVSASTLATFSRYLEEAFFGSFVTVYAESVRKQQINPKKFYLVDSALHNFITMNFSTNRGRLLENIVYTELERRGMDVTYYRTASGQEVDFLSRTGDSAGLIQVCYEMEQLETANRERRALIKALHEQNHDEGLILTYDRKQSIEIKGKKVSVMPVYEWLLSSNPLV